jgi:ATP-dependent DNA helicase RecQ
VIFHDATLRDIALQQPSTLEALGTINGVGARKREAYGPDVIACVAAADGER